jgi:hypothetical protein
MLCFMLYPTQVSLTSNFCWVQGISPIIGAQATDIEYMRLLQPVTNIIPLVSHADMLSPDQLAIVKEQVAKQMTEASVRAFTFGAPPGRASAGSLDIPVIYGISSANGPDYEVIDASLLMDSTYVQPLVATDLPTLLGRVFCPDGSSWLRHSAAKKYLRWRQRFGPSGGQLTKWNHQPSNTGLRRPFLGDPSSYIVARVADHAQREERLAQIRLANWANELQRSLANERARYEALARDERAAWLAERVSEQWPDKALVSVGRRARSQSPRPGRGYPYELRHRRMARKISNSQDPLGLLQIAVDLKWTGWIALEVLGGLSLLSGLTIWVSRHDWQNQLSNWLSK